MATTRPTHTLNSLIRKAGDQRPCIVEGCTAERWQGRSYCAHHHNAMSKAGKARRASR